jgi:hypothetical protein
MSFIGSMLAGAAKGFIATGNPIGAGIGALAGAVGGSGGAGNALSAVGNGVMSAGQSQYLAETEALQQQQLNFQFAVQAQSDTFDNVTSEKSEIMRESNELRNVAMEQRKADNEITKEFIKSIA